MTAVSFTVHGVPAPQGSKNQFGGESNPRTRPWRAAVTDMAAQHYTGAPMTGPVSVRIAFRFTRPKSHYGTGSRATILKHGVPALVSVKPDVDKLARACLDAITGVVIRDDAQVAHLNVWKEYADQACAHIEIRQLEATQSAAPTLPFPQALEEGMAA